MIYDEFLSKIKYKQDFLIKAENSTPKIGEICEITNPSNNKTILGEVIGFDNQDAMIFLYEDYDNAYLGQEIKFTGKLKKISIGTKLLGKVIDPLGNVVKEIAESNLKLSTDKNVENTISDSQKTNQKLSSMFKTGIRAVDLFVTLAKGQKIAIYKTEAVGAATFIEMIMAHSEADIKIQLLGDYSDIDEITNNLPAEELGKTIFIQLKKSATSIMKMNALKTAVTIAKYFKTQNKEVLLIVNDIDEILYNINEIYLLKGAQPYNEGWSKQAFTWLRQLLECCKSITTIYEASMHKENLESEIIKQLRKNMDGHIFLSRQMAEQNIFPAVHILGSLSKCMENVVSEEHYRLSTRIKTMLANYLENNYDKKEQAKYEQFMSNLVNTLRQKRTEKFDYEIELVDLKKCLTFNENLDFNNIKNIQSQKKDIQNLNIKEFNNTNNMYDNLGSDILMIHLGENLLSLANTE